MATVIDTATSPCYVVTADVLDLDAIRRTGFLGAEQHVYGAASANEAIRVALPYLRRIVGSLGPLPLGITATLV